MNQLPFVMYLRKSSEAEDRQKLSIPAQEEVLTELVSRRAVKVFGEPVRESMSAKQPGRPLFNEMMRLVEQGKVSGIVCWHLDRLARNLVDGARVIHALDLGLIHEIVTPQGTFTATGNDKLMMTINFGMATKYSDDLSVNVKRGNKAALDRGKWPARPKLGYKRDPETGAIVADPKRFNIVKEMWRLRLLGTPVLEILERATDEWGLTTPRFKSQGGGPLSRTRAYAMFQDPFYASVMSLAGETFTGNHPPLVTWAEFETVQRLTSPSLCRPKVLEFRYRGLMRCGRCSAVVTAEQKTQRHGHRYIYYHCSQKGQHGNFCPERSIEETKVDEELMEFFGTLVVPRRTMQVVLEVARELDEERVEQASRRLEKLDRQLRQSEQRVENFRRLCADDVISVDELKADRERELAVQRNLHEQLKTPNGVGCFEPFKEAFSLVNEARFTLMSGTDAERRELLRNLVSNLSVRDREMRISAKKQYQWFAEIAQDPGEFTNRDNVRKKVKEIAESISAESNAAESDATYGSTTSVE